MAFRGSEEVGVRQGRDEHHRRLVHLALLHLRLSHRVESGKRSVASRLELKVVAGDIVK